MYRGISMFMNREIWVNRLLIEQNVVTNEKFTGGDILKEIGKQGYNVIIHEPVYEGVFKHSKEPFIQVDWLTHSKLPDIIEDTLDITGDNKADISVVIDTVNLKIDYKVLREDIKGLMAKGSLVDIRVSISDNESDGLFYYHDKVIGGITYAEGVSIRVVFHDRIYK